MHFFSRDGRVNAAGHDRLRCCAQDVAVRLVFMLVWRLHSPGFDRVGLPSGNIGDRSGALYAINVSQSGFCIERVFRAGFKKGDAKGKPNPLWSAGPMTLCWGFTKIRPMGRPKPEIDFASVTMPGEMPMISNENNVLVRPQPACTGKHTRTIRLRKGKNCAALGSSGNSD